MHGKGKGILGMELIGNGSFRDPGGRGQSIGQSIEFMMELDSAITNISRALVAV